MAVVAAVTAAGGTWRVAVAVAAVLSWLAAEVGAAMAPCSPAVAAGMAPSWRQYRRCRSP